MRHHIRRTALALAVLAAAAALTTCDGASSVSGRLDGTRHLPQQTRRATRPRMVKRCRPGTTRVRHTSGRGSKKRTWYTTEHTTVCSKVRQGTETYRKVIRPERWCVELDDVNGKKSRDEIWYQVERGTYQRALAIQVGDRMSFVPEDDGC
ncbi:hypothetical protein [Streptomyces sp. MUM 16J]|uniref:hypothetical protein n=1 Tax=Streptomyces sp. MUM 16J TaxID=2791988 RepID=UPI001F040238|nr:hypothetical protein [Streptomyces sp. MUM 16J]MCH0560245.1 hypothetical protein [Streptomyces sp. MUM 16J]